MRRMNAGRLGLRRSRARSCLTWSSAVRRRARVREFISFSTRLLHLQWVVRSITIATSATYVLYAEAHGSFSFVVLPIPCSSLAGASPASDLLFVLPSGLGECRAGELPVALGLVAIALLPCGRCYKQQPTAQNRACCSVFLFGDALEQVVFGLCHGAGHDPRLPLALGSGLGRHLVLLRERANCTQPAQNASHSVASVQLRVNNTFSFQKTWVVYNTLDKGNTICHKLYTTHTRFQAPHCSDLPSVSQSSFSSASRICPRSHSLQKRLASSWSVTP